MDNGEVLPGNKLFSDELITELGNILGTKYVGGYTPRDLQEIGLKIAKFVFMKEVFDGKI